MKLHSLTLIDHCTLAYNGTVLLFVLTCHSRIPQWPLQILPNLIAMAGVLLLALLVGDQSAFVPRLIRNLAPLGFFLPLYIQTGGINQVVFQEFLDPVFMRIEEQLFGFQPAALFARRFPQSGLSEYMHFAYASYYLLFPGLAVFLYLHRGKAAFLDYMFSLCVTMYVCLWAFILLPVRGPVNPGLGDATGSAALPFTAAMAWIYQHLESDGAAFPSSHVAIAALVLYYTVRYARPAAWVVGPLVISLMVSTVYCSYHYVIDVLAGLLTAAALLPLCRRMNPALRPQ